MSRIQEDIGCNESVETSGMQAAHLKNTKKQTWKPKQFEEIGSKIWKQLNLCFIIMK